MSKTKSSEKLNFERKTQNGKPNPKDGVLLKVDKSIAGQTFGCFSFITP